MGARGGDPHLPRCRAEGREWLVGAWSRGDLDKIVLPGIRMPHISIWQGLVPG